MESLLHFETVKHFGAAKHEADTYDRCLRDEQEAEYDSERSLVLLNGLQQLIVCGGLLASMIEAAGQVCLFLSCSWWCEKRKIRSLSGVQGLCYQD